MLGWWMILNENLIESGVVKIFSLTLDISKHLGYQKYQIVYFKKVVSRAFLGNHSKSYVKDI